jgi:2-methylcitrate dehydratase
MLAVALSDGTITVESFSAERIRDPKLPPLMDRIRISENPEFTRKFPASMQCRIEITTRSGARHVEAASYPKGHAKNPMTDAEVQSKYRTLCRGIVTDERREAILKAVWALEGAREVAPLLDLIRIDGD